ncbi:MAG: helix-turn-helix domain-containing protein [Ruminococcaceae bacterium]|nr:helix-turn-helix domain-containing protein [Oscillospiraceae bacterium]
MLITDKEALKKYSASHRLWQGIPGIEVTKGGKIYLTFYSGTTSEGIGNYVLLLRSDDGAEFDDPVAVATEQGEYRCFDPCVWIDPLGRLWLLWARAPEHAVRAVICEDPDADELIFGEEFTVGHDVMMNKPTVLSGGEWIFPVAVWNNGIRVLPSSYDPRREGYGSFVYSTEDYGKTFVRLGGADVPDRTFDEHMVAELKDGTLMMYVRTRYGIGVSYSYDRGLHWSAGRDSGIPSPNTRFHLRRLSSGRLMLITHVDFTARDHLTVLLSEDDGKTWKWKLLLDARNQVSYPDATERDGFIYITYDRERGCFQKSLKEAYSSAREILVSRITEEDIIQGKLVNPESYLARVASKLGKYADEESNPYLELVDPDVDVVAKSLLEAYGKSELVEKIFEAYPVHCINVSRIDSALLDARIALLESGEGDAFLHVKGIIEVIRAASSEERELSPVIALVRKYVLSHLSEDISVSDVADAVGISRYYMSHLFKRETGTSVIDYIGAQRILLAKKLLAEGGDGIGEIAYACGFSDASYFTKRFSAAVGMTPGKYRELHKT